MLRFSSPAHERAAALVGLTDAALHAVQRAGDQQAQRDALEELQKTVKRAYKKAVRDLHPDRHADDPEKESQLKELTQVWPQVWEFLSKLRIVDRAAVRRPVVRIQIVHTATTSGGSSVTNVYNPWGNTTTGTF